jgi:hypothetical protein
VARNTLPLEAYEAHTVIMPVHEGKPKVVEAVCVTVFAANFPQRAIAPELLVGEEPAQRVAIARDQRSLRAFFLKMPPEQGVIRVRYGDSLEGVLAERFSSRRVRPLPKRCED